MLSTAKKGIRGGVCHAIYQYAEINKTYLKDYHLDKESSYLIYWDLINLFGWTMPLKLLVNVLERIKVFLSLIKVFQKTMIKNLR